MENVLNVEFLDIFPVNVETEIFKPKNKWYKT